MSVSSKELVADARSRVDDVSVDDLGRELAAGSVLVDLRERDEIEASGRIPGSVHVPRGMLEFCADPSSSYHVEPLHPDRRVILYCASGGRSALAAQTLRGLGYADVAHLDGGFAVWTYEGKPVER